jgi:hypothetical protein
MELLKNHKNILPFAINPTTPVFNTIEAAGFNKDNFFITYRYLDPLLFDLNKKGFLNGHTPFSSIVAFNSLLAAHLTNSKYIALSNEASSNEPTVPDSTVNHQYSKSILFENDFRNYVSNYINDELNYFSFLRPLSELQIAKLFSKFEHQYNAFKSCNVGGKNNIWCCSCAKCLFTYIILSPFITQTKMKEIFGKNIFDDDKLKNELDKLSGVENIKPFECVGTVEEVNIALQSLDDNEVINKPLLQHYRNSISANTNYIKLSDYDFQKINENNFLPDDFKTILINALKSI